MKLNRLQHNTLLLRETRRRFRSRKTLLEASGPLTGAYYWYPKKGPNNTISDWDLMSFYDQEYNGDTLHEAMWPEMLQGIAIEWGLDYRILSARLRAAYTGLPRGRVSLGLGTGGADRYNILHGNDAPPPNGIRRIIVSFNLTKFMNRDMVVPVFDEHETCLPDDVVLFRKVTKIPV